MRAPIDSWFLLNEERLSDVNVKVEITERDLVPQSVIVDLYGPDRMAMLIVWANGVAEIQAGEIADGSIAVDEAFGWSRDEDIFALVEKAAALVIDGL